MLLRARKHLISSRIIPLLSLLLSLLESEGLKFIYVFILLYHLPHEAGVVWFYPNTLNAFIHIFGSVIKPNNTNFHSSLKVWF